MSLGSGDHVWYWNGRISQDMSIPRADWFPGSNTHDPSDYLGNGEDIYNFVLHSDGVARGRPHMRNHEGSYAWLNNNPGNITGPQPDFGQYPGKFNWHHFLIFPTWEAGFAAIAQYLRTPRYVDRSIIQAFELYAPASDGNDPAAYAHDVASAIGIDASFRVGDLDDDQMVAMQNKITEIEGAVAGDMFAYDSTELPDELRAMLP